MSSTNSSLLRSFDAPAPEDIMDNLKALVGEDYRYSVKVVDDVTVGTRDDGEGNGFDLIIHQDGRALILLLDHESWYNTHNRQTLLEHVPEDISQLVPFSEFAYLATEDELFGSLVLWYSQKKDEWFVAYGPPEEEAGEAGEYLLDHVLS